MRVIVRTVSELCITVGAVLVLFVVHVLFWTGVQADDVMDAQIDQLRDQWSKGTASPGATASPAKPAPYSSGRPFAIMYIPRLGFTWNNLMLQRNNA